MTRLSYILNSVWIKINYSRVRLTITNTRSNLQKKFRRKKTFTISRVTRVIWQKYSHLTTIRSIYFFFVVSRNSTILSLSREWKKEKETRVKYHATIIHTHARTWPLTIGSKNVLLLSFVRFTATPPTDRRPFYNLRLEFFKDKYGVHLYFVQPSLSLSAFSRKEAFIAPLNRNSILDLSE